MSGYQRGFTLVELIAVLIILGIIGLAFASSRTPSASFQLQSSRDQVVAAFFAAQQLAMAQSDPVSVVISSPNQIDVRREISGVPISISFGGTRYPITLLSGQSLTAGSFAFDRLGRTNGATLTLRQGASSVDITVSPTGYIR